MIRIIFLLFASVYASSSFAACDRNATTSTFATELAAATTGQTICLASGNYGTFAGTNKAVTIQCNTGQTCNMTVAFGSGDTGFTIDGMSGMSGDFTGTASNITIKNSTFTGEIAVSGTGAGIVLDSNTHNNICGTATAHRVLFDGPGTIQNSHLEGCGSDGVRLGTTAVVNVLNNYFLNIIDDGSGNHTDNVQFYGGSNAVIRGNYFKQTIQGETQVIGAFDGTSGNLIEDNVVDVISRPWGIELYADNGSIIRHNTVVYHTVAQGCFYNINCGGITLDVKSGSTPGRNTQIYDNIATFMSLENGSTASVNTNNLLRTGGTAPNLSGIPVFVGGANPTTYEGYALASGSPGKGAATDGLDVGIRLSSAPDTEAPTVPTGLTATAISGTRIDLSWTASTDNLAVSGYDIRRCAGAGCTPSTIITTTSGSGTTYSNTGLTASTVYRYDIRARDNSGNLSAYTSIVQATTGAAQQFVVTPSERLNPSKGVINPSSAQSITEGTTTTFTMTPSANHVAMGSGTCGGSLAGTTYTTAVINGNCTVVADYIASICGLQPTSGSAATGMVAQTGTFTYRFSVIPVSNSHDLTLGHTNGTWTAYTSYATTVRFSSAGVIDVRNGASYTAMQSYPYVAYHQYDVRMDVNVAAKTYSVWVADNGGLETQIANNYSFRSDQSAVTSLNNFVAATLSGTATGAYYCPTGLDTTDILPPTINLTTPANGSSVNGTITVSANATDNVGVVGVQFKRDTSVTIGSEDTTSPYSIAWDSSTTTDGAHTLTATARDAVGNTANATPINITVDNNAPSVPTGLAGTPIAGNQVNLSWTASTDTVGVSGYDIRRCTGSGCTPSTVIASTTGTGTAYSNTGLTDATIYRYDIRAKDAIGNSSSYSTIAQAQTQDITGPTAPSGVLATVASSSQVNLSWVASTDNVSVTNYSIERCSGASCSNFAAIASTASTTYSNTGLTSNTLYRYRVRAQDSSSNYSAYSAIVQATTDQASSIGTTGAETWYVRPASSCANNGDGLAYSCALTAGGHGAKNDISALNWTATTGIDDGDTLYVCGNHGNKAFLVDGTGGTSTARITVRFDCPSDPGSIDRRTTMTEATTEGNWTNESGSLWYLSLASYSYKNPGKLYINGTQVFPAQAKANLGAQYLSSGPVGLWWYDSVNSRLYYYSSSNPASSITEMKSNVQAAGSCAWTALCLLGGSYFDIVNPNIRGGQNNSINIAGSNNRVYGTAADSSSCLIRSEGGKGISVVDKTSAQTTGNEVYQCTFDQEWLAEWTKPKFTFATNDGIFLNGTTLSKVHDNVIRDFMHGGISFYSSTFRTENNEAYLNTITCGATIPYCRAFSADDTQYDYTRNNRIYRNFVSGASVRSQMNGKNNVVAYNVDINRAQESVYSGDRSASIHFQGYSYTSESTKAYNNFFGHNTYGPCVQFQNNASAPNYDVTGHVIANNILYDCGDSTETINGGGAIGIQNIATILSQTVRTNTIWKPTNSDKAIYYRGSLLSTAQVNTGCTSDICEGNIVTDPQIANSLALSVSNIVPEALSPVVDSGTDVGETTDYYGNPIWGNPDIGPIEYQPTLIVNTDKLPKPSARIYAGNAQGRARATETQTGTCGISVSPSGGTWSALTDSQVRPAFGDLTSVACGSGVTSFVFTPSSSISNPRFRVWETTSGNNYRIRINGTDAGALISGCSGSICSDVGTGVTFSYVGSLNSATTFEVSPVTDTSAPVVTITGPVAVLPINTTSASITATTDESATCKMATSSGVAFGSKTAMSTTGTTSHSQTVTVTNGQVIHRWIACQDAAGNISADKQISFSVTTAKRKRGRM